MSSRLPVCLIQARTHTHTHTFTLEHMEEQVPFLGWSARQCAKIYQCVSPTEILRWWMDLMDWVRSQLPFVTNWITEWTLKPVTCIAKEWGLYGALSPQSSSSIKPSDCRVTRSEGCCAQHALFFPNKKMNLTLISLITFLYTSLEEESLVCNTLFEGMYIRLTLHGHDINQVNLKLLTP